MSGKPRKRSRPNPLSPQRREYQRLAVLGEDARCAVCGHSRQAALRLVPHLTEAHHPLGRQHVPGLTIVLCANCHALYTASQLDDHLELRATETELERLIAIQTALGSFFRLLGESVLESAHRGQVLLDRLEAYDPEWRDQPWTKP